MSGLEAMNEKKKLIFNFFADIAETKIRTIAEISGIIVAIVTIMQFVFQIGELRNDQKEIYNYFTTQLKERENTIQNLREENFRSRTTIQQIQESINELQIFKPVFGSFYGRVSSSDGSPIADVKIEAVGGAQVFSNINGEFLLTFRIGQLVQFEKNTYKPHELNLNYEHLNNYQKIVLVKGE